MCCRNATSPELSTPQAAHRKTVCWNLFTVDAPPPPRPPKPAVCFRAPWAAARCCKSSARSTADGGGAPRLHGSGLSSRRASRGGDPSQRWRLSSRSPEREREREREREPDELRVMCALFFLSLLPFRDRFLSFLCLSLRRPR